MTIVDPFFKAKTSSPNGPINPILLTSYIPISVAHLVSQTQIQILTMSLATASILDLQKFLNNFSNENINTCISVVFKTKRE